MLCPRCGARRALLVLNPSGIGCRGRELNLTWRTTRQTSQERRGYLDALLLDEDGTPQRPREMREKTFASLPKNGCA